VSTFCNKLLYGKTVKHLHTFVHNFCRCCTVYLPKSIERITDIITVHHINALFTHLLTGEEG